MSITIKDIALKANISYPSVSRALSGKPGVSKKTRDKVLKIAKELNYKPNALARGLVQSKTSSIGLIIPDIINPFFPEIAKAIDDEAHRQGYNVFLCNSDWDEEREDGYIRGLSEKRVDGIIIFPASEDSINDIKLRVSGDTPVVVLGSTSSYEGVLTISIDDVLGASLSTTYLLDKGHKNIAFIGGKIGGSGVTPRLKGFRDAHEKFNVDINEELIIFPGFSFKNGYKAMDELLQNEQKPDAVFAENDVIAMGVIQAIRSNGYRVPEDIAVAGFDDIPMASMYGIELTTVHQPKYELGQLAFRQLLSQIEGDDLSYVSRRISLEPELIIRKTT